MCGITTIFNPLRAVEINRTQLAEMNDAQLHRGPDEGSIHIEPHIGLGHRRLSVIDIKSGQQPLFNEDKSVVVVFNGEIYNFGILRQQLEADGHRFSTNSDTEVIVHGWEQWGKECVQHFRGMFAFVLWDRTKKTLFAARDRMGVKPLHYGQTRDGTWLFGSELKALTVHPELDQTLDPTAIEDFLALGYVPDPKTIWSAVRKLAPAHRLLFRIGEREPSIERYWNVSFEPDLSLSDDDASDRLIELLDESVKLRMISEVPLGAFLSGGVDSSAVVASMAAQSAQPIKTCSIAFDDPLFDESKYAAMIATKFKTDHVSEVVNSNDFDLLDTLVDLYDEPFSDSSAIPTYRLCEFARKRVTVALSGDGGDETFGGYRRYRMHLAEDRVRRTLPSSIRKPLFGFLGSIYPKLDYLPRYFRAKTTFQAIAQNSATAYFNGVSVIRDDLRESLYCEAFKRKLSGYRTASLIEDIAHSAPSDDPLSLIQYIDYQTYLPGDINTKVDRASMAHSLEVREPLMDHKLIEWAGTLKSHMKIRSREGKFIFKKSLESALPLDVLYRPKMGFSIPLSSWLKGPLSKRLLETVDSPYLQSSQIFDNTAIRRLAEDHLKGRFDHSRALWSLIVLEGFLRTKVAH
jgi:asparagine synthase (glutamine-hydrolysing)